MFGKNKEKQNTKEIKENRFRKVAGRRVKEILNKMRLLKNCANKNNYDYTESQVSKIFSAIDNEWRKVKAEFNNSKINKEEFSL